MPEQEAFIDLPEYDIRCLATARDPLAVVEAHRLNVCFRLAWLLGLRMCPRCPQCNNGRWGCQDLFGSNMRPTGGVIGGVVSMEGGNENQQFTTPHFHGQAHVVCAFQYLTLDTIATRIKEGLLSMQDMVDFQEWYHMEMPLDEAMHDAYKEEAETEFFDRHRRLVHTPLCTTPAFLHEDALSGIDAPQWRGSIYKQPERFHMLENEGAAFRQRYRRDTQFVISRVQHHVHKKNKEGRYEPLNACAKKVRGKKRKAPDAVCKHEFPRAPLLEKTTLVCKGLAKSMCLKVSGRRNAYGSLRGKRKGKWQSGCIVAFASHFRSNSHSMPGHRVPPILSNHSDLCCKKSCRQQIENASNEAKTIKVISKRAQRIQRECTGYYCGYTFKAQPVGRKYVKLAQQSLNYVTTGLEDKTDGQRWHRLTQRVLHDLNHRCTSRPAVEEYNLAAYHDEQDVTNAEFIRTFRSQTFPGGQLVRRLEEETRKCTGSIKKILPPSQTQKESTEAMYLRHFPDLYGFRATASENLSVYYLNPWEFVSLWEVRRLPPPCASTAERPSLTVFDKPGEPAILNPSAVIFHQASRDLLFYPETPGDINLRHLWYMVRRRKPMVPSPAQTPMPDKYNDPEKKAQLYSLYLRPWVLERTWATGVVVPHITMLDALGTQSLPHARKRLRGKQADPACPRIRSYAQAWRTYIRGHVVSRHAQRIIVQFMAACCGKSKKDDDAEEKAERSQLQIPANDLKLARVHAMLDGVAEVQGQHLQSARKRGQKRKGDASESDQEEIVSSEVLAGMHSVDKLWQRDRASWSLEEIPTQNRSNSRLKDTVPTAAAYKRSQKKDRFGHSHLQSGAYVSLTQQKVDEWWKKVQAGEKPPSQEQTAFLTSIIQRCRVEQRELSRWESAGAKRKADMFRC